MKEKQEHQELLLENEQPIQAKRLAPRLPLPAIILLAIAAVYGVFQGVGILCMPMENDLNAMPQMTQDTIWGVSKIPLEAHIM